ncbi:uncharacterized protein LOC109844543 isoform X3 [Asparagus officinalis]|nr:uncharacterized protein LOC109844543 isoform X3 [Asparagus officinalis]
MEKKQSKRKTSPSLANLCIESASSSREIVETWRRQKRTLERLPSHLADALFRRLRHRRLLYPSLLEVFQHCVEEVDLSGESSVDAEWMAYLGGFRNLRILKLSDCRSLNNHALWPVTGLDGLKELDLSRCSKVTDAGIKHVLSIPSLEKLFASETGMSAEGVKALSYFTSLRTLDLGGIPVTDKALGSLQSLAGLEYLDLWGSEISNNGAALLENFPRLNFLNLAWTKVTVLPHLPSVTTLNMSNCTVHALFDGESKTRIPLSKLLLTGATIVDPSEVLRNVEASCMTFLDISGSSTCNFSFLVNMRRLEHLDLSSSNMSGSLIDDLAHVGDNLRYLNLSKTKITSEAIALLAGHVSNLETLSLSYTAIDDASLPYIGMMTSLRTLDLSHTGIQGFLSDKTFSLIELQNLSILENLNLEETLVRDEALYPLAFFRELKCLYLKSNNLSDIALQALSSPLPNLQILGFRGAVLTNSGLLLYSPSPVLRTLDLRGCWLLTADVISLFCKHHPRIEIRHDVNSAIGSSSFQNPSKGPRARHGGEKLLEVPILVGMNSAIGSSSFQNPSKGPRARHGGEKLPEVPIFVDERIKYVREELLDLRFSPLSNLTLQGREMLPTILRKESDA